MVAGVLSHMAKQTREHHLGYALVAIALFILWWLNKQGLLHESVSSSIVSAAGTVVADPVTGFPQFDPRVPSTVPTNIADAVAPIDVHGTITNSPANPALSSCPIGTSHYHNVADDTYWCVPV
jgi:hypothetical protein